MLTKELYEGIEGYQRPYEIADQSGAIWALRKIKLVEQRRQEAKATAMAEADKIMKWYEGLSQKADRDREYFDGLLLGYMNKLRQEDPKLKTVKLPDGELKIRKQQPEYTYDDDQLLAWAKVHYPEYVQVKETVYKPDIKSHIKETGEVVPGVTISDRPDKFIVEVE
jgi:phage host-nuclease inhibitor protein Gam